MVRRFFASIALTVGLGVAGFCVASAASADTAPASSPAVSAPAPASAPSFWW